MSLFQTVFIRPEDRTYHNHSRACRTPHTKARIVPISSITVFTAGVPFSEPLTTIPPGNRKQTPQQYNKGDVVYKINVEYMVDGYIAIGPEEGNSKEQSPEGRNLPEIIMPEMGGQEGTQSYRQENPGKGECRPHGEFCPDIMYAMGRCLCRNSGTGKNKAAQDVNHD